METLVLEEATVDQKKLNPLFKEEIPTKYQRQQPKKMLF